MKHHSHIGVYAVIKNNKEEILVIKKALGCYTGLLDLPGGSIDEGETMEQALIREVKEETGCDVTDHQQIGAFDVLYPHQDSEGLDCLFHHIGVLYTCSVTGTPMEEGDGRDSHGCVWVDKSDVNPHNAAPFVLTAATI